MSDLLFSELELSPKLKHAVDDMGFDTATSIQSQAIPLIRTGVDVIGRSQTGTGKTVAFAIPAIEKIDKHEFALQVLILCPTRELAQQACAEIQKLTKYKSGIKPVEVYGGVPMERQIKQLKHANIVIGTPGRIMDHMRRRTLRLNKLKMIVLDEADEMLSMGFKEDIETILTDTPDDRQTVLFSATMPPAIMALTRDFQTNPAIIEINKKQVTLDNITQSFIEVPMGRKLDALCLLLHFYSPKLAMIFCNTKKMVDNVTEHLNHNGFMAEGLHGDMKQSQRTKVMDSFKFGKTMILVATDVAARGIDVNNIDYVINYDIPQNTEYYVHRIGRTGRAGKKGTAISICSGRSQVYMMRDISRAVRSEISRIEIPSAQNIQSKLFENSVAQIEAAMADEGLEQYAQMIDSLSEKGHDINRIAMALAKLHFKSAAPAISDITVNDRRSSYPSSNGGGSFKKMIINIGRSSRVAPNHVVGAITERTTLNGNDIGKIEIFDDKTIVSIPEGMIEDVLDQMVGCKICGRPTVSGLHQDKSYGDAGKGKSRDRGAFSSSKRYSAGGAGGKGGNRRARPSYSHSAR